MCHQRGEPMPNDTYSKIKDELINKVLLALGIIAIPIIAASLLRITTMGWHFFFLIHILSVPVVIGFAIFRKSISLHVKILYLILILFIISSFGFLNLSLSGSGVPFMMLCILIAVTFLKRKTAVWLFLLSVIIIAVIGLSYITGIVEPEIDLATYHSHLTSWIASLATYSIVIGLVIFLVGNIGQLLSVKLSELEKTNDELQLALKEINTLQGILPICSYCKKIRDDKGYWNQLEIYIHDHSDAKFSHSICPECMKKMRSDLKFES